MAINNNIVHAKFKFQIPEGKILSKLSKEFPRFQFNLQSLLPLPENKGISLIEVKGRNLERFRKIIAQIIPKNQYTVLYEMTDRLLLNFQMEDPWFLLTIIKTNLILKYPIVVQSNQIFVDLIAERSKVDHLFDEFEVHSVPYSIKHIGRFITNPVLTYKQEQVLKTALDLGYFEIPRKISLSLLAKRLQVAPTSLSEMFRRIFKRLGINFFSSLEN
ncbi:MAG: helix-turn-helix domain-containing protein [Candidatus Lokiarchaeota archaeon]|nr:helix-turn-helix domain-containing protein [Candidatus Harpocratesius repetitus]